MRTTVIHTAPPRARTWGSVFALLAIVAFGAVASGMTGCAPHDGSPPATGQAADAQTPGPADDDSQRGGERTALPFEAREALPEGFPLEIPVVDGVVTHAELLGAPDLGPWRYHLASPGAPAEVRAWYVTTYRARSWEVVHEAPSGEGFDIVIRKGSGAWSTLRIRTAEDSVVDVECWSGIGVEMPSGAIPPSMPTGMET